MSDFKTRRLQLFLLIFAKCSRLTSTSLLHLSNWSSTKGSGGRLKMVADPESKMAADVPGLESRGDSCASTEAEELRPIGVPESCGFISSVSHYKGKPPKHVWYLYTFCTPKFVWGKANPLPTLTLQEHRQGWWKVTSGIFSLCTIFVAPHK